MKNPSLCITRYCRNKRGARSPRCSKCQMRKWRAAHPMEDRLANLRSRAKKKKLPFDLDASWLAEFLKVSGYDPSVHHIDRICVLGGYTKGNLQILDGGENISKGNRERYGQAYLY